MRELAGHPPFIPEGLRSGKHYKGSGMNKRVGGRNPLWGDTLLVPKVKGRNAQVPKYSFCAWRRKRPKWSLPQKGWREPDNPSSRTRGLEGPKYARFDKNSSARYGLPRRGAHRRWHRGGISALLQGSHARKVMEKRSSQRYRAPPRESVNK